MSRARYGGSPEDFWGALRGVWLAPSEFFARLDPDAGFVRPTVFVSVGTGDITADLPSGDATNLALQTLVGRVSREPPDGEQGGDQGEGN